MSASVASEARGAAEDENYIIVAFAMDLTGFTPADEMFHFSATDGTPQEFDRYIMTYRNISHAMQKQLGASIVTKNDAYRVLIEYNRRIRQNFEPRTFTEYSTMVTFIRWLNEKKTAARSSGIILAYSDHSVKVGTVTPVLLHAITRYGLQDSFFEVVKGFVNVSALGNMDTQSKSLVSLEDLVDRLLVKEHENPSLTATNINIQQELIKENGNQATESGEPIVDIEAEPGLIQQNENQTAESTGPVMVEIQPELTKQDKNQTESTQPAVVVEEQPKKDGNKEVDSGQAAASASTSAPHKNKYKRSKNKSNKSARKAKVSETSTSGASDQQQGSEKENSMTSEINIPAEIPNAKPKDSSTIETKLSTESVKPEEESSMAAETKVSAEKSLEVDNQEISSSVPKMLGNQEKNAKKPQASRAPFRKFDYIRKSNARARTIYIIFQKLSQTTTVDSNGIQVEPTSLLQVLTTPADELRNLEKFHAVVTRHYSLGNMLFGTRYMDYKEKARRSLFRKCLSESGVDMDVLFRGYEAESVDGVKKIVENIDSLNPESSSDLVKIIVDYFQRFGVQPRKGPVAPSNTTVVVDGAGDRKVSVSDEDFTSLDGEDSPHDDEFVAASDMNDDD